MKNDSNDTHVPLVLFGVPLHNLTFASTLEQIDQQVASGRSKLFATANLDFHRVAAEDPEMQRVLFDADIMMADGFPMVKLSPFFGPRLRERVTGSDMTPMLAAHAAKKGHRLFFLGAAPGVARKAADILMDQNPGLNVVGCYSPEKADLINMNNEEVFRMLEELKPDVLLVAFGAPKQEKWIQMHRHEWQVPVAMGIGGSFDFIAGAQVRSPVWMQKLGLEWLGRLLANPKRLAGRYALDGLFLLKKCAQFTAIRLSPVGAVQASPDRSSFDGMNAVIETMRTAGSLEDGEKEAIRLQKLATGKSLVVIPEQHHWLNSVELGILVHLARILREQQQTLIVCSSSRRITKLLKAQGLHFCFELADSLEDAAERVRAFNDQTGPVSANRDDNNVLQIALPLELTAAGCAASGGEKIGTWTDGEAPTAVHIDASRMRFIDSAGIARLVDLRNRADQAHISIAFSGIQRIPKQIISQAGQDGLLRPGDDS